LLHRIACVKTPLIYNMCVSRKGVIFISFLFLWASNKVELLVFTSYIRVNPTKKLSLIKPKILLILWAFYKIESCSRFQIFSFGFNRLLQSITSILWLASYELWDGEDFEALGFYLFSSETLISNLCSLQCIVNLCQIKCKTM